jgi:phosphatidylglycerol---prolipoprotein diacylglyceryl transferase
VLTYPDIDPVALQLGPIAIRWYGIAYVAAFFAGALCILNLLKRPELWADPQVAKMRDNLDDLIAYLVAGVIIGGRLGHVIFYDPGHYLANPLEIFQVWEGGMSFHGGFLGSVIAILAFSHFKQIDKWIVGDLIAVVAPIGIFLVRLANFVNGEIVGSPSSLPWAMVFPGFDEPRHPAMLYEALTEGVLLFAVLIYLVLRHRILQRPGLAVAVFLIGYAAARIFCEFFKFADHRMLMPDWPITKGMALSVPMLIGGVWLLMARFRVERSDDQHRRVG